MGVGVMRKYCCLGLLALGATVIGCSAAEGSPDDWGAEAQEIRNGLPWAPEIEGIVQIEVTDVDGNLRSQGTGTLVAADWVLTAGHVVDALGEGRLPLLDFYNITYGNNSNPATQFRYPVAVYFHPGHDDGQPSSPLDPTQVDAALIRLNSPFDDAVTRTIFAGTNEQIPDVARCFGYGFVAESGNVPTGSFGELTYGDLFVQNVFTNYGELIENFSPLGSQVPLAGDSGGPCTGLPLTADYFSVYGIMTANDALAPGPTHMAWMTPASAFRDWALDTMATCTAAPGSGSFATLECQGSYGAGDCDEDTDCGGDLRCASNYGPMFNMTRSTDVCVHPECTGRATGSGAFCDTDCRCGHGGGDCDSNSDCLASQVCDSNVGPAFKMTPSTDVCVNLGCETRTMGSSTYCSSGCPCGFGGGDCDSTADCQPGLVCGSNFGPAYGRLSASTDICMPSACASRTLGSGTFCSTSCPCGNGGGDCDSNAECFPGLTCHSNVGASFGYSADTDVCLP